MQTIARLTGVAPVNSRLNDYQTQSKRGSILIVDDTPDNLSLLSALLKQRGYQVHAAGSGRLALAAVRRNQPDLILLDVRMPQMDGYEVCQILKADPQTREIPVIFVSALNDVMDKVKAFQAGGADYVTKPFQIEEVLARVETHLSLRLLQRQLLLQNQQLKQEIDDRERVLREQEQAEAAILQQAKRERLIKEMTQRIHQSLDLNAILNTTVSEVRQFLQVDRVIIYRLPLNDAAIDTPHSSTQMAAKGLIVVESVSADALSILGTTVNDPCFNTEWYQCYQEGRVSTIADVCNAPIQLCHQELLQDLQIRANLVVPILQGQSLWGLLAAHECFAPRTWQQVDVDFLMQLADQVAIAIQQSELYQQIQHLNAKLETQVQRRTAQLEKAFEFEATLKRITDKVRDSLDEDQIMQHAVQELAIALKAISCNAALYDFEQGTSTIHYEHTTLPYSAVGRVAQLADYPEIYRQIFNGIPSQFCSILPHPIRGKVAMLAYPILDDQGVLGDLWLVNHQDYRFTDEDVRLVQQVANQCAIALRQSRLYQEAQAQVKELERLNHLKDDFLSTVSHELRTPMSNIKMAIQMLEIMLKRHGLLSAEVTPAKRYFQILQNECEREINLINDLLDLSRLEAEAEVLELSEIALQTWIPRMVEPFFEKARNHQVEMRVDVAIDLPHLITDAVSLSRVLSELLSNACKYTPPLGTITLTVRQQEDLLELQVINSGVEIPVSEQNRIFEKFYRIPNSDPWKHGGTGLGLALVKKLLDCLGGTIEVDSAEGCTAFTAKIPTAFV